MNLLPLFPFTLASLLLAAGCTISQPPASIQDSFAIDLLGGNSLNSPYVPGATFTITVVGAKSTQGWTLTSSNPAVLAVTPPATPAGSSSSSSAQDTVLAYDVTAGVVGQTTLTVLDASKNVIDSAVVSVVQPTSAALYSYARILGGETDAQSQVSQVEVAAGGTATLLVRYFAGTTEVSGIGSPGVKNVGASTGVLTMSSLAPDRDWLQITGAVGSGSEQLVVAGLPVATVPVTLVDPTTIASVSLAKQSDANAKDGQVLSVVGRSFDAQGTEVFGASYAWTLDGVALPEASGTLTDLASYTYQSGTDDTLGALRGALTSSATIHALHRAGTPVVAVSNTEPPACAVAGGAGWNAGKTGTGAFVFAAFAGALVLRRQKRRWVSG